MEPYIENQFQNSGLLRFRSAPSSLISSFRGGGPEKGFGFDNQSSNTGPGPAAVVDSSKSPRFQGVVVVDTKPFSNSSDGFSLGFASKQLPPPYPMKSTHPPPKRGSNLTRQSSSPAGFFTQLTSPTNGYNNMMRKGTGSGVGNFRLGGCSSSSSSFSSSLGVGHLPRIPEIGADNTKEITSSPDGDHRYRNGELQDDDPAAAARFYGSGLSFTSWNDSSSPRPADQNSSGLKAHHHHHQQQQQQQQQEDRLLYSGSEASPSQSGGILNRTTHMLSHHLSLPKTSSEMTAVEKMLNFQDTVPCKVRAKRGCATHPRSIAERVRRTRISERMKKLQELVPNMDKQINTSDMLDLAVDYIKELQKQYKVLCDTRARCRCIHAKQPA